MFYILRRDKKHFAEKAIDEARSYPREQLSFATQSMIQQLCKVSDYVSTDTLQIDRTYGLIEYSPFANAWRNGVCKLNHGEIYICSYTFLSDGKLHAKNAWGYEHVKNVKNDMMLIEN